jgi:hypothetical protein
VIVVTRKRTVVPLSQRLQIRQPGYCKPLAKATLPSVPGKLLNPLLRAKRPKDYVEDVEVSIDKPSRGERTVAC